MKTITVKDAFYIATAPYNREIVIIADVGEYGCLKILANSSKYFKAYEPQFQYFNGKSLKKITKTYLKSFFTKALKFDPTYFSISELKTLGEIFKLNGNGKTNSKDITNTGEYPFYKASNLNPSGSHKQYDFDGNNYLLIVKSGGSANNPININYGIGKVFLVNGKCAANIAVFQLLPITDNNIKYLYYYLLFIQTKIQSLAIYCTNNGNINMNELMNIEIPIPSLEKQQEIVDYLDFNNNLIDNLNKEIENNKKQGEIFFNMFLSD